MQKARGKAAAEKKPDVKKERELETFKAQPERTGNIPKKFMSFEEKQRIREQIADEFDTY